MEVPARIDPIERLAPRRRPEAGTEAGSIPLDRITRIAARLFDVPIVAVVFLSQDQRWISSARGVQLSEEDLRQMRAAFLEEDLLHGSLAGLGDAARGEQLIREHLGRKLPRARFYATAPIRMTGIPGMGALFIADEAPRVLTYDDIRDLEDLAATVTDHLKARHAVEQALAAEQRVQRSQDFITAALNSLEDIFFVISDTGHLVAWNERLQQVTGYTNLDLPSCHLTDLVDPADLPKIRHALREGIRNGRSLAEGRLQTSGGESIPYEFSGAVLRDRTGRILGLCGTGRDISDRKAAENALRSSEEKYRHLFERTSVPVFIIRADDEQILEANPQACQTYGFAREELIGRSLKTLTADVARGEEALQKLVRSRSDLALESVHFRKNGASFHTLLNCSLIAYQGQEAVLCFGQDISERKQYESELLAAKEHAEEMASFKDAMLTNMNHEIRTPLAGIIGCAHLLGEELDDDRSELVLHVRQNGERLLATLDNMLALAKLESGTFQMIPTRFDANERALEVVTGLQGMADTHRVSLALTTEERLPVEMDGSIIDLLLSCLVSNGIKFAQDGHVRVRLGRDERDLLLVIEDDGVGISADFMPYLFETFRQESRGLSRSYEGSGLGLAIVKRVIDLVAGDVSVDSTKNEGTTVRVRLPGVVR